MAKINVEKLHQFATLQWNSPAYALGLPRNLLWMQAPKPVLNTSQDSKADQHSGPFTDLQARHKSRFFSTPAARAICCVRPCKCDIMESVWCAYLSQPMHPCDGDLTFHCALWIEPALIALKQILRNWWTVSWRRMAWWPLLWVLCTSAGRPRGLSRLCSDRVLALDPAPISRYIAPSASSRNLQTGLISGVNLGMTLYIWIKGKS